MSATQEVIEFAIADPGHFVDREPDEGMPRWQTRAVLAALREHWTSEDPPPLVHLIIDTLLDGGDQP